MDNTLKQNLFHSKNKLVGTEKKSQSRKKNIKTQVLVINKENKQQ